MDQIQNEMEEREGAAKMAAPAPSVPAAPAPTADHDDLESRPGYILAYRAFTAEPLLLGPVDCNVTTCKELKRHNLRHEHFSGTESMDQIPVKPPNSLIEVLCDDQLMSENDVLLDGEEKDVVRVVVETRRTMGDGRLELAKIVEHGVVEEGAPVLFLLVEEGDDDLLRKEEESSGTTSRELLCESKAASGIISGASTILTDLAAALANRYDVGFRVTVARKPYTCPFADADYPWYFAPIPYGRGLDPTPDVVEAFLVLVYQGI